jgi:DNA-binding LacI/PurR family transcriptional regulator
LQGYLKALTAAGLETPEAYQQILATSVENGSEAASRLLELPAAPTAIVATNTFMAIGVIHEIHRRQLSMPGDISFLMFDDPEWASLHRPGITTVAQPIQEIGARAFSLLSDRIQKKRTGDREEVQLPTTLLVRGSCGPAPRN